MEKCRQWITGIGMVAALCLILLCAWLIWVSAVAQIRREVHGAIFVYHPQEVGLDD